MTFGTISFICILSMLISLSLVWESDSLLTRTKKRFSFLAFLIAIEVILDTCAYYFNGKGVEIRTVLRLIKVFEFIFAPMLPMILACIVSKKMFWGKMKYLYYALILINATLQVLSLFTSLMFEIDEMGFYRRTNGTYGYVMIILISYSLLVFSTMKSFVQKKTLFNSLFFVSLLVLMGILLRTIYAESNADWLCICFSYYIFLSYFSNYFSKIDVLTSLLSQNAFLHMKRRINFSTAFIMIDINNFKQINDTYGHKHGDECLSRIGEAILNVYGKYGFCYRIGGDEFCIIFKPKMLNKLIAEDGAYDCYASIGELMGKLNAQIQKMISEKLKLEKGVAQGFGLYYTPDDCGGAEYVSVEEVLKIADKRMYEEKISSKNNTENVDA